MTSARLFVIFVYAVFTSSLAEDYENNVPELKPVKICESSLTFHEACNVCQCNKDGTRKFCTQHKCSAWGTIWSKLKGSFSGSGGCEPGREYKVGCQMCECDDDGNEILCPDGPCIVNGPILRKYYKHLQG